MPLEAIMSRLKKAFRNFAPSELYFSDYEEFNQGKQMVVVLIVTENFEHIRLPTRCRMVDDTLKAKDPELAQSLTFAYECYTPEEYRMIKLMRKSLH